MKLRLLLFAIIIIPSATWAQDLYPVNWSYNDLTFKEFVTKAESTLPVRFFFKDEWIDSIRLKEYPGCADLACILNRTFAGTNIFYFFGSSGNIILTKDYAIKGSIEEAPTSKNLLRINDFSEPAEQAVSEEITVVDIGNPAERYRAGNVTLSGYVRDGETGEPLASVTVYIQKLGAGTVTNGYGFYSLSVPRGAWLIQYSFLGMKERKLTANLYGTGELNIEMKSVLIPIKGVVVSAQRNMNLTRFELGLEKINISTFKLMPTSLGETDVLKSILLIPGVQSVGEGSAGFNVRGGAADQNLILLDGAPVHNPNHLFGFFSSINPDIIKDVTLYKGGIPGRYGGRISSVLDISLKDGNKEKFAGKAGISPITASFVAEGPIIKDTLSFLLAGRTTYSDWLFGLIKDPLIHNSTASFSDLNMRLNWNPDKNNKIDFSSYFSNDIFSAGTDAIYKYVNSVTSLRWLHFFSSRLFTSVSLNNSFYKYKISTIEIPEDASILTHSINTTELRVDFNWFRGRNELNYGLDITAYSTNPGTIGPVDSISLVVPHSLENERGLEPSLYIDDRFKLTDWISVSAGVRLSSYFSFGPRTVYLYDPYVTKSSSSVIDTINYRPGSITSKYFGPELRMSVNMRLSDRNSFKINYNRMRQNLLMLTNTAAISPTDSWKISDSYLRPMIGDQIAAGFYQMLFGKGYELSAEVYYKKIRNMSDFKGGLSAKMSDHVEQNLQDTEGKAYGVELSVKKSEGKVRYFIGYTYSRSFSRSTGKFPEEIVNSGNWYPSDYDRPNDLIITFNYLFSRRFSFSCNYLWSDGRPVTYPIAAYSINGVPLVHYSDRNRYRIPDYSRLDISMNIRGNLRSHKIANPNWTFSIYNLLGRDNVYSVYFKKEGPRINGYSLSVFDRPIPSVSLNFEF